MRMLLKLGAWIFLFPFMLAFWLWGKGWIGKGLAGVWVVLLLIVGLSGSPSDEAANTTSESISGAELAQPVVVTAPPTWTATTESNQTQIAGVAETETPTSTPIPAQVEAPGAVSAPTETPVAVATPTVDSTATTFPIRVPAGAEMVQLVRVVDGDTIEVLVDGRSESVRYIGIDTPEQGQPGYQAATEANRSFLGSGALYLVRDRTERDRFGRLLRYVYNADGIFVDAEMVRQGWAQPVEYPPDTLHAAEFRGLAREAAEARAGFWSGSSAYDGAMSYGLATDEINVRQGPGTDFGISGPVVSGTPVTIFGRNEAGDWVQVRTPDRTGGWMYAPLLTINVPVASIGVASNVPVAASSGDVGPVATATSQVSAPAAPVQTTSGGLRLGFLSYNGAVAQVESDEYIEIVNDDGPINLQGWRLMDDDGSEFRFPAFEMATGQTCRVYTNEIHGEHCGFSFGSGRAIWGNSGDVVMLVDASGALVERQCWGSGC